VEPADESGGVVVRMEVERKNFEDHRGCRLVRRNQLAPARSIANACEGVVTELRRAARQRYERVESRQHLEVGVGDDLEQSPLSIVRRLVHRGHGMG
jgi:hypothetical protein